MNNIILAILICLVGITLLTLGVLFISNCRDKLLAKKPARGTFEHCFIWAGGIWGVIGIIIGILAFPLAVLTLFLPF